MNRERPCVDLVYQRMINALGQAIYYDWSSLFEANKEVELTPVNTRKKPPADYTGLGAVVLSALLCRPWWKEDELAETLHLPLKPVRRVLRLLETHGILAREHRKQKKRKRERAGQREEEDEENDVVQENDDQGTVISYSSIDYQRAFDVTRLKIHKMRQNLKAELEDKRAIQEFRCPLCEPSGVYTTLQMRELLRSDGTIRCPECDTILESTADDSTKGLSRKERTKKVAEKQAALDDALRPLSKILGEIEQLIKQGEPVPDFGALNQWLAREQSRQQSLINGDHGDGHRVDINMGGETVRIEEQVAAPRVLPPWLRNQQASQANGNGHVPAAFADGATTTFTDALLKDDLEKKPLEAKKDEEMKQYKEQLTVAHEISHVPKTETRIGPSGWEEVGTVGGAEQPNAPPAVKADPDGEVQKDDDEEDDEWEDA